MFILAAFGLVFVLVLKYYTAAQMRNLERRLNKVKAGLQEVKEKLTEEQDRQRAIQSEEILEEERIRAMKELIQDLQYRMTQSDRSEDELVIVG